MKPQTFLRAAGCFTIAWALFAAALVTIDPFTDRPDTERGLANIIFRLQQQNDTALTKSEAATLEACFDDLQSSKQRVMHYLYGSSLFLVVAGICLWCVQSAHDPRCIKGAHL